MGAPFCHVSIKDFAKDQGAKMKQRDFTRTASELKAEPLNAELMRLIAGRAYSDAKIYVISLGFNRDALDVKFPHLDPYAVVADELGRYGFNHLPDGIYYALAGESFPVSNLQAMQALASDLLSQMAEKYEWFWPALRRATARRIEESYDMLDDLRTTGLLTAD